MNATTQESMHRRAARNGDEQDAFSRSARRALCALDRAGVVHRTKIRAARRDRRSTRQALRLAGHWGERTMEAAGRADVAGVIDAYDMLPV
jgi:hypothetical protein